MAEGEKLSLTVQKFRIISPHVTLPLPIMRILDRYIVREIVRHAVSWPPHLHLRLFRTATRPPDGAVRPSHRFRLADILALFLCIIPGILVFTIPMAVLIGVLLGLGRMSMDSEIISAHLSRHQPASASSLPVGLLTAVVGAVLTLLMTVVLAPRSLRAFRDIEAGLIASQISFSECSPASSTSASPTWCSTSTMSPPAAPDWHGVFLFKEDRRRNRLTHHSRRRRHRHRRSGPGANSNCISTAAPPTNSSTQKAPINTPSPPSSRSDWPIEDSTTLDNWQGRVLGNAERSLTDLWHDRGPTGAPMPCASNFTSASLSPSRVSPSP